MFTDIATTTRPTAPTAEPAPAIPLPRPGGPQTADGKRVAARNATTHGLFARDVVLPHLGEDPQGYADLLAALTQQIGPANLLEQHYTEKIAAASWRLRRLQRWQAQVFEDPHITEDQALERLDRVMRHETALHRQIDQAVRTLGRDLPQLFEGRARRQALAFAQVTERDCREDPEWDWQIAVNAQEQLDKLTAAPPLDPARLDAAPDISQNCQNEPAPVSPPAPPELGAGGSCSSPFPKGEVARNEPEGVPVAPRKYPFCRNEPAPNHNTLSFRKERVASLGEPGEVSHCLGEPGEVSHCLGEPGEVSVRAGVGARLREKHAVV